MAVDGSRLHVVGEAHMGANKYAVLQRDPIKNGDIVLDFAVVAKNDVRIDIRTFADHAVRSEPCRWSNLGMVPNFGPLA